MNNFILLQKIRIREFLNSLSKKKALSTTTLALMVLLLLGVFIFLSISFNYSIYYALKVTDNLDIYYPTMASLSLLIIIITAVTNLKGTIYNSNDYMMLKCLPIKKSSIVISKIVSLYLSEIKFSIIFLSPAIYFVSRYSDCSGVIAALLIMFLLPFIPILVFGIITVLFGLLFEKNKFSSIIITLLSIGLIAGIYILIYLPNDETKNLVYTKMYVAFKYIFPPVILIKKAVLGEIVPLIYFACINILVFIVTCFCIVFTFDRINMASESRHKNNKTLTYGISKSVDKTFLKKEISRILSSTNVLINTLMGPVMSVLVIVLMMFSSGKAAGSEAEQIRLVMGSISLLMGIYMYGITPYTSFAISLEKDNLWIVKTAPIEPKTFFKSKIIAAYIFTMPFSIATGIVVTFVYKLPIYTYVLNPLIIILYIMFITKVALIFNLLKPHLTYNTEMEVIKKGSSSIKCLFATTLAIILIGVSIIPFMYHIKYLYFGYIIVILLELVAIYIINNILQRKGNALFYNIY